MELKVYNKLVRDKIPEVLESKGLKFNYDILSESEFKFKLKEKLKEEVEEYIQSEELEELADICEVIHAILAVKGIKFEELEKVRLAKQAKRGGFKDRILLKDVIE